MVKVKILEVFEHRFNEDSAYSEIYTVKDTTDWDNVTDEQFKILLSWACEHNRQYNVATKYVITAA